MKTSRSSRMWTILFIIQIAFIALIYLLQEKHDYIKKQGTTLGNEAVQPTDQDISPRDNHHKAAPNDETCG
ncbi:hypothetical protein Leryth_027496 [Lithospermum erythrorhizon]|nr:hypothetical protein Leryth_027496 [Lithospermum erythrorhizon]